MIKILSKAGYDDGYYWDMRIVFEYEGQIYSFIDIGSGSGYIPCYMSISYGNTFEDALCSEDLTENDVSVPVETLIEFVEKLKNSGDTEYSIEKDDE